MSFEKPASLRKTYSTPSTSWSFVLPSNSSSSSSSSHYNICAPSSEQPTYQWSSRRRPSSIYDLSDLSFEASAPSVVALVRAAVASAALQYTSAAIVNPLEVGKTLLQVQYVPKDAVAAEDFEISSGELDDEEASDSSSADIEDSYFTEAVEPISSISVIRPTDEQGYVVRNMMADEATRPYWVVPLGRANGVWDMVKLVIRWKPEGWLALWKGTTVSCMKRFLESSSQPVIHSVMASTLTTAFFTSSTNPLVNTHPFLLPVASNVMTGFLLSPLDLIRTRLMVQSFDPRHRRYTGPFDAFNQILLHEGGFHGLYLHPQLLYPTLLECALTPLLATTAPYLFARMMSYTFGTPVSEDTAPFLWEVARLAGTCAGFLVTLPIETVRRRLQVQTRGTAQPLATCVEVRHRPYTGILDALYSILVEERSDLPLRPQRPRASEKGKGKEAKEGIHIVVEKSNWLQRTGAGQLYRGLGLRVGASVVIFLVTLLRPESGEGSGWTEL